MDGARTRPNPADYGFLIDPYADWLRDEGIPVVEGYGIDLFAVETKPWPRFNADGAVIHLKGRGEFNTMFLLDVKPGQSTPPMRHMYEEIIFVLEGRGSTQVELSDGRTHSFEWGPKSLFCIPLNAKHRHFNASGQERARLALCNYFPLVKNLYHSDDFIFNCSHTFADREGESRHFEGDGDHASAGGTWPHWVTNFVPDVGAFAEMMPFDTRGATSTNISFHMADGVMKAHMSGMPVGTYKKAHRHGPDFFIFNITGSGYSLMWSQGDQDYIRVDWRYGMLFAPPDMMFHQHFNTSGEPARYLAVALGSMKYPFLALRRKQLLGSDVNVGEGGGQIEYADQDPRIHALYLSELEKNGVRSRMGAYIDEPALTVGA
jgi:quercetin dioxygenase-like cupin family protein